MNQSAGPVNTGDILYSMRVTLFITLLCIGYSLSRPISTRKTKSELLLPATISPSDQELAGLPLWQRKASKKAIEKYAATQDKKWSRWNEAMFERSS